MRVVYHSYEGRFSDSPRAIYEALADTEAHGHVWMVNPAHEAEFPADVDLVEYASPEAIAVLDRAHLLVANTHTDFVWSKRPGTVYLQTWHGTPLKRIHRDVLWAPDGRLERLDEDVDRWDKLVSPNAVSTPLLRRAFRFEGEIIETGYPRNDALNAPGSPLMRERVREDLGIRPGTTAVLYMPTWRDDVVFPEGGKEFGLGLDLDMYLNALGDDTCLLLRVHRMLQGRLAAIDHPAVRDVSLRAEVADLYLAADVLVTDYSSAIFDFAVTGKPILIYAYDLDDFRDRLRGFYFDLESIAPTPVLRTTDELVGALGDLEDIQRRHEAAYSAFRQKFCHLEDGGATNRVIDMIIPAVERASTP